MSGLRWRIEGILLVGALVLALGPGLHATPLCPCGEASTFRRESDPDACPFCHSEESEDEPSTIGKLRSRATCPVSILLSSSRAALSADPRPEAREGVVEARAETVVRFTFRFVLVPPSRGPPSIGV